MPHVSYEKMYLLSMLRTLKISSQRKVLVSLYFMNCIDFYIKIGFSCLQLEMGPLNLETLKAEANIIETQYFMLNVMNSWNI